MLLHLFDHAVHISIELPFEFSRGIIDLKRNNLPMHVRLFFLPHHALVDAICCVVGTLVRHGCWS